MRVLHILDHSLPYFSGYSFRSDYIVRAQRRQGLDPVVLTSPKHEEFQTQKETIEDTDYYRIAWPGPAGSLPLIKQAVCVMSLTSAIVRLASRQRFDVLHAHSPALNGLAAARAARRLGLPWVYEVRYFEEDAAVDRGKMKAGTPAYRMLQRMELHAVRCASRAITISEGIGRDLISRGIAAELIDQVPNGVDTRYFTPQPPDGDLVARFGLQGCTVIGFIGSFYLYEGLEHLIDAMALLLARRRDVKLLLAGEGETAESLRRRVPEAYRGHVIFAGKVPHEEVRRYYSVMDVVAYPRIRSRLTELTTPLKPLEAMSMERLVIGADIGGIRELLAGGEAGAVFEADNPRDLADCLFRFVEDSSRRQAIGKAAREFVVRERDWNRVVARYPDIYGRAIGEREYPFEQSIRLC